MWAILAGVFIFLMATNKSGQQGTTAGGTNVNVVPASAMPVFGVTPPAAPSAVAREPVNSTWQSWQLGPNVPVPAGSRNDYLVAGNATSDSRINQNNGLQAMGGGPTVINPLRPVVEGVTATGSSGTGVGVGSGGSGAPNGGFNSGGGFGGRGPRTFNG